MNKQRRAQLATLEQKIEAIKSDLDLLREEEQSALDNMPESLQDGERADVMRQAIEQMEEAHDTLSTVVDLLQEVAQ